MPRITDSCSCIYEFGCKLSLVRLCDSDFGITPVDDITIGITCAAFCFHTAHISFASSWYLFIIIIVIIIITQSGSYINRRPAVSCSYYDPHQSKQGIDSVSQHSCPTVLASEATNGMPFGRCETHLQIWF